MFTLLMLISHTLSDFVIQTSEIVKLKSQLKVKGFIYHGLGLLLSSLSMLLFVKLELLGPLFARIVGIVIIHLTLDLIKESIQKKIDTYQNNIRKKLINISLFTFDQAIHIFVILIMTHNIRVEFNMVNDFLLNRIPSSNVITYVELKTLFIIMFLSFSGAYLIPLVFDLVYANVPSYNGILNAKLKIDIDDDAHGFIDEVKIGKWIGVLERILIVIFIMLNQVVAIGFIIAMKSLARFKMMDNKIFSEYYLLGTLFSVTYTICGFIFLNSLL